MEISSREFIDSLVEQSAGLQAAFRETLEYWNPAEPPVTTLFAALGDRIAEDFDKMTAKAKKRTFELIEAAMTSGDDILVTAVATGLIEAIVAKAARHEGMWHRIAPVFGNLSRKHADVWLAEK